MATIPFAKKPAQPASTENTEAEKDLLKQAMRRVARGKQDRGRHQSRITDCYKYAMPWRHGFNQTQPPAENPDIYDETIGTVLEDFSADMLNTFTPQKNNWLEEGPVATLPQEIARQIEEPLKARRTMVFGEMSRSNLYQSLQEGYLDLGPGTMALIVIDKVASEPLHCEAIPATDLILARGPYGTVDPFREKYYLRSEAKVLWPDANWALLGPNDDDDEQPLEIIDGCWRDWENKGDETYHYVVASCSKLLYHKEWKGPGSCPFIVARWSRDSTTAYGVGPTYRTLPAIKTRNHVRYLSLKNYDKHVDPVTAFEDDGVINVDGGVEAGMWLPIAPGSEMPQTLESRARFDVQVFEMQELASVIRRAHYQDKPAQLGKTPPTATQWADEAAERARRMGTPATNLVHELQIPLYRRFVYLLDQRGVLPRIDVDGEIIQLQPISPLLRAQEQEEIVRMDRFAEMVVARLGPQLAPVVIDVIPWVKRLAKLYGVDEGVIRDEAKIQAAIDQLMPILSNFTAGRPPEGGAPPPVGVL